VLLRQIAEMRSDLPLKPCQINGAPT